MIGNSYTSVAAGLPSFRMASFDDGRCTWWLHWDEGLRASALTCVNGSSRPSSGTVARPDGTGAATLANVPPGQTATLAIPTAAGEEIQLSAITDRPVRLAGRSSSFSWG